MLLRKLMPSAAEGRRENLPDDHEDPDAVAKAFLELNENLLDNPNAWHTAVPPKPKPRPHARRRL